MDQLLDRLRSLRSCLCLRRKRTIRTLDELAVLPDSPLPSPFGPWIARDLKGVRVGVGLLLGDDALHVLAGIRTGDELLGLDGRVALQPVGALL
jgi:hypothetical protein